MKTMAPVLKLPTTLGKPGRVAKPLSERNSWGIDPDQVMARKIHELATKPVTPVRQTSYKERDVQSVEEEGKTPIQWPTNQKIEEVSKRLLKIKQMGIRSEASGDYFNSGDLAYQMQEVIRATGELFQKIQRIKLAQR
jgi:hypothetical protein